VRRVALVAVAAVALTACGVPNDSSPRSLPADAVPFELLAPDSTGVTTTTLVAVSAEVPIYLVGADRLVAARRLVESPVELINVLQALLAGATADEGAAGLRSAIIGSTQLISVRSQSGVATIDLTGDFATIGGQDQILAVAQLVFTVTALPGIVGIKLSLDGRAVEVPRGDGTLTQDPLKPADFAVFAPTSD
jgi:spore germination protein GerM